MRPRIAICMTSHNRLDCARIGQEIVTLNYRTPLPVVHATSSALYEGHLEAELVRCPPLPLNEGAMNLLRRSVHAAVELDRFDYLVHVEADVWLMDESVVHRYVDQLQRRDALFAVSPWTPSKVYRARQLRARVVGAARRRSLPEHRFAFVPSDVSTQFMVMSTKPAAVTVIDELARLARAERAEKAFQRAMRRHGVLRNAVRISERGPSQGSDRYMTESLGLYCQHWPARGEAHDPRPPDHPLHVSDAMPGKREVLQGFPGMCRGDELQRLLVAQNLDYYNAGALRY